MSYPIPLRTTASTDPAVHLQDHRDIQTILGRTLFTTTTTRSEHVNEHNALAKMFGRPQRVLNETGHAASHVLDQNTINAFLVQTNAGIRGAWGPQSATSLVPGWPASFTSSHTTWASLQTAVNAAGTSRKFRVTANLTATGTITLHAGDQVWFNPGVTVDGTGLIVAAFSDGGTAKNGCKIMNGTFTGFRGAIQGGASQSWEVAYCDFSLDNGIPNSSNGAIYWGYSQVLPSVWFHHNICHDMGNPLGLFRAWGALIEDNEFTRLNGSSDSGGGYFKIGAVSKDLTLRHNWMHDNGYLANGHNAWFDWHNSGIMFEWNRLERSDVGIEWEVNPGSGTEPNGLWTETPSTCRYNYFSHHAHQGIRNHGSSNLEIYGNVLERNQMAAQTGENDAEIAFWIGNGNLVGGSDMSHNRIHNNYVIISPSVAGQQPKRGGSLIVYSDIADPSPWYTNLKDNLWYENMYVANRATTATDLFAIGTAKSYSQWSAVVTETNSSIGAGVTTYPVGYTYPNVPVGATQVSTSAGLLTAIANAANGETIALADGTYELGTSTVVWAARSNVTLMAVNAPNISRFDVPGGKCDPLYAIRPRVIINSSVTGSGSTGGWHMDFAATTTAKVYGIQFQGGTADHNFVGANTGNGVKFGSDILFQWCRFYNIPNAATGGSTVGTTAYCEFDECGYDTFYQGGTYSQASAVKVTQSTGGLTAHHCYAVNCGSGFWGDIALNTNPFRVEHCYVERPAMIGVHFEISGGPLSGGQPTGYVRNCVVEEAGWERDGSQCTAFAKGIGFANETSKNMVWQDNYAFNCRRAGMYVHDDSTRIAGGDGFQASLVYLTNNITYNNGTLGGSLTGDIVVSVIDPAGVIQSGNQ